MIEGIFVNKLLQCQKEHQELNEILAQDPENTKDQGNKVVDLKIIVPKSANLSKESCKTLEDNNIFSDHSPFIPDVPRSNLQIIMDAKSIPSPIASQFDKLPEFKNTLNSFPPKAQQFYSKVLEGYDPRLPANNQANQNLRQNIGLTIIKHQQMLTSKGYELAENKTNHTLSNQDSKTIKESESYEQHFERLLMQSNSEPSSHNSFDLLRKTTTFFNEKTKIYNHLVVNEFMDHNKPAGISPSRASFVDGLHKRLLRNSNGGRS